MSEFEISVNVGESIGFLWEKFLRVIGRDPETLNLEKWFYELQQVGWSDASYVQCIGMHTPLPLGDIYRPTRLLWQTSYIGVENRDGKRQNIQLSSEPVHPDAFLRTNTSAAIVAGPGWGKTTFLHYLFLSFIKDKNTLPLLITLRRPGSVNDLMKLVETLGRVDKLTKGLSVMLLVDGYDEISLELRKKVSLYLNKFKALGLGRIYLSCREFYDIIDLNLPKVKVAPFDETDQMHFVRAFTKAYGSRIEPKSVLSELRSRGLNDLLEHPLLLAMVCIVKSGSLSLHSRSVLALIDRALDTLSFRWDEGKGIAREERFPLDGRARIHCLMRIAYHSSTPQVSDRIVMQYAREQLDMLRWDDLDERQVMLEIARFYGILVPTGGGDWEFVHKTLYDYLGARFMMQTGIFNPEQIKSWNSRLAYAACLGPDATTSMVSALRAPDSFPAFVEMLSNDAPFDHSLVANALIKHYENFPQRHFYENRDSGVVSVQLSADFVGIASTKFLQDVTLICSAKRTKAKDTFFAYAAAELLDRKQGISRTAYAQAFNLYGKDFLFKVHRGSGWQSLRVSQLIPQ